MNIEINKRALYAAIVVTSLIVLAIIFFTLWPPVIFFYGIMFVGWGVYYVNDNPPRL
jgi:hypothetical protein